MNELQTMLSQIEHALDTDSYTPGPWARFVRQAKQEPETERARLAADVTRVSNKLHSRKYRYTMPFLPAFIAEMGLNLLATPLLRAGVRQQAPWLVGVATYILASTMQPLIKIMVGSALGVRYSYVYAEGMEPRFKMAYGTYLAAPAGKRAAVQASGTVGTPLALGLIATQTHPTMPRTTTVMRVLFWFLILAQVLPFIGGLINLRHPAWYRRYVQKTSGGNAGIEVRGMLAKNRTSS
jgi:hypothetical protein